MLRNPILILALSLSLSLPSWGAEENPATSLVYEGAAGIAATTPGEIQGGVAASSTKGRNVDDSVVENVDCFYQQDANQSDCAKAPKAQAQDRTPSLYQKARN